jgi:hypothetical protein
MKSYEIRIELTDTIVQELLWHAFLPDSLVMMPAFNDALEQQYAELGPPPKGAQVSGISVASENGSAYAEITYTQVSGDRDSE